MNREGRRKNLDAAAAGATSDAWAASAQPLLGLGLKCLHHAPVALVPLIIRWGAETRAGALIRQGAWRHVRATGQALKNCKNLRERR